MFVPRFAFKILMNASAMHMSVIRYVQIFPEVITVLVIRVITCKIERIVLILMNVLTKHTIAVHWLRAQIHLASSLAHVTLVIQEMEHTAKVSVDALVGLSICVLYWLFD